MALIDSAWGGHQAGNNWIKCPGCGEWAWSGLSLLPDRVEMCIYCGLMEIKYEQMEAGLRQDEELL